MSSQVTSRVTQVQHGHGGPGHRDGGAAGPGQDLHRQEAHPLPQLDRGQHQVMMMMMMGMVVMMIVVLMVMMMMLMTCQGLQRGRLPPLRQRGRGQET